MEEVYKSGKVKAIGVANWSIPYLEKLSKTWKVVPAVNQVELHPFLPQHKLREYCAKHDILLEAYSPLGSAGEWKICHDEHIYLVVANLGSSFRRTYDVSPATILISYHVNKGVVVLPKSVHEKRIISNKTVIELSDEDIALLDDLAAKGKAKRINTPLWGWDLGFDDWYGPSASSH